VTPPITPEDLDSANITRTEFARRVGLNYFSLANRLAGRIKWKEGELVKGWEILKEVPPEEKKL
jgi:hypothetical protein